MTSQFSKTVLSFSVLLLLLVGITACGGNSAAPAFEPQAVMEEPMMEEAASEEPEGEMMREADLPATAVAAQDSAAESSESNEGLSPISNTPNVFNRLIIKNGEVELTVEDTDAAINRSLGIITEYRGYVVSNRTWINDGLKYATLTIGVPADNFEEMLRRLKDLAVTVNNETISGQDVTDEFVDLESRLRNLNATADRIRDFLAQAQDVDQSLKVSNQLSQIEAEVEQVQGRMNYLKERASFSTITLQFAPAIPTPTPTPEPTATPTPEPWTVTKSIDRASGVTGSLAASLFQITVELVVWLVIVILPFLLPIVALLWAGAWLVRRVGSRKMA